MADVYVGSDGTAPSDGELILEVRGGSLDAYGALYERHASAAQVLARQYVRTVSDADDVVAEAFHRVLGVLQQGDGPDTHFRAYLFTVVRRLAADLARRARRTRPTADDGTFESALGPSASPEDPALAGFENTVVARAYQGLPERWQAVLWYTEIEQLTPAQVAPILGLTPNGVSALAYRAREGLRVGYLQEHLTTEPADSCRKVNALLGGYVRGSLASREVAQVDAHLEVCGDCRTLALELADVAHGMRGVIGPLVVGVAGMAVLGALPLGLVTGGALGAGAAAGTASGAAGGVGVGLTGSAGGATAGATTGTSAGVGAAAGSTTAGATTAGATTAGATTAGAATAGAATGSAATGGAATAATATAAGATTVTTTTATTAVAATTAGVSGATVAASTGAVAVATAGVVSVLGAIGSDEVPAVPDPPLHVAESEPWPTGEPTPEPSDEPTPEPSDDPTDPVNFPFLTDADLVMDDVVVPTPAEVVVAVAQPDAALTPRATNQLALRVSNPGETEAAGSHVLLTLPAGVQYASASSPSGASAGVRLTSESLACTPTSAPQDALCTLGTLAPGETRTVTVPLVVRDGGSYTVTAQTWADGVETRSAALEPVQVEYFGPELTAEAAGSVSVANPGLAQIPFAVRNSGDRPVAAGWTAKVRVPAGLVPQGVGGKLGCRAGDGDGTDATVWLCTGDELAPGESASGSATVVADGTTAQGSYDVKIVPELPGGGPTVRSVAVVSAARAWEGANAGAASIHASCRATGGLATADAVVVGTYTNLTGRTISATFEAAGTTVSTSSSLAPGESVTLTAPDGLRVPSGGGTWTLSTSVGGATYSRTVSAGSHGAAECYDPSWNVQTAATVLNDGGKVRVEGTVTNRTSEPMQASMTAAGGTTDAVRLGAGDTVTLGRTTGGTDLAGGTATFHLYRWVTDSDGDQPTSGVVPAVAPTAAHDGARIAPAAGQAEPAGTCTYDAGSETSWRTFTVPVDNSGSTLPVVFTARAGGSVDEVRLAAGAKGSLELRVPWGTSSGTVSTDGGELRGIDVGFGSCAEAPGWPATVDVSATAQCDAGTAQVVVDVAGDDGRSWAATLLRHGEAVGTQDLAAHGSTRFVVDTGSLSVEPGTVTVHLERTIEGNQFTADREASHDSARCVVRDPDARLDQGDVQMDRYGDYATSWREAGVILDNTRSNVRTTFHVVGPHGLDEEVVVAAGETGTVESRRVDGRRGATWTVSAGDWSTQLGVETFTAAEAGWCPARVAWGSTYAPGDVRSWNGNAYRYLGWDGTPPGGERGGNGNGNGNGHGNGNGKRWYESGQWDGVWMGQWRQWEKIGLCEYR
ncbi:RNA polymerase sigma factor (sigma-70 family) [Isoptericola sp. CG 20/1183]|uniref:RNA polymerase sigma factor (Sigma-70 family) n=1 Tax=Isoptericola halotolerans TaxID=300560 RepID=A0ABX5E9N3_9MICO|nr:MULTISPECIES: sigma-70 family RNA polymerase sigma factor [Isoptericola]PRZ03050.1 RNA polymerase sigma factor (sigma-70 family) [Isoptericola sp. CG 20/1183]PRZ03304.1 RNA polymerase sigma factor (sigma-70 family) [Isoptericola halotolerans]